MARDILYGPPRRHNFCNHSPEVSSNIKSLDSKMATGPVVELMKINLNLFPILEFF